MKRRGHGDGCRSKNRRRSGSKDQSFAIATSKHQSETRTRSNYCYGYTQNATQSQNKIKLQQQLELEADLKLKQTEGKDPVAETKEDLQHKVSQEIQEKMEQWKDCAQTNLGNLQNMLKIGNRQHKLKVYSNQRKPRDLQRTNKSIIYINETIQSWDSIEGAPSQRKARTAKIRSGGNLNLKRSHYKDS